MSCLARYLCWPNLSMNCSRSAWVKSLISKVGLEVMEPHFSLFGLYPRYVTLLYVRSRSNNKLPRSLLSFGKTPLSLRSTLRGLLPLSRSRLRGWRLRENRGLAFPFRSAELRSRPAHPRWGPHFSSKLRSWTMVFAYGKYNVLCDQQITKMLPIKVKEL